jgi:secreted PhoX family phosphatase
MALAFEDKLASAGVSRRSLLRGSAKLAGLGLAAASAGAFTSLAARPAGAVVPQSTDYGPLVEIADETTGLPLLKLPEGFRYISYGWTGDPLADGKPTPSAHDGMGVVVETARHIVLVRNHEQGSDSPSFAEKKLTFDPMANGGTTNLLFDKRRGEWVKSWATLSGTVRNCCGGITPWGSWLTCEETLVGPSPEENFTKPHGWVFDVPGLSLPGLNLVGLGAPHLDLAKFDLPGLNLPGLGGNQAVALKGLGRMSHEAVAVDPDTGIVYETEDANPCGFYRFIPKRYGQLTRGGRLQMMRVVGEDNRDLTGHTLDIAPGTTFNVAWVDVPDPETNEGVSTHLQGADRGGAFFTRLEGCWHDGGWIFFTSTDGGLAHEGQVWQYEPQAERLTLIYVSPGQSALNNPDNITISPRGGIILCEDGGGGLDLGFGERLQGLTLQGEIFPFAENNIVLNGEKGITGDFRDREWAGATFSASGHWLFVNIQTPGITFAITGPWGKGAL